jgi:hypothetical protein
MDRVVGVGRRVGGHLSGVAVFVAGLFLVGLAPLVGLPIAAPLGCSGGCDSSKCAPGNKCIDDGSGIGAICRKVCSTQADCPFNYYCNDAPGPGVYGSWCAKQSTTYPERPGGQWGAQCPPSGGEANNPACDGADGFACYGVTPTDANAFCTVLGCKQDTDCPGGWWCASVNEAPNVTTSTPSYGVVGNVCTPRDYCAPCQKDHDCALAPDGTPQHCVQDTKGQGYCTPACAGASNCALDATCAPQWSQCTPGAGAACKTDDDCPVVRGIFQHCDAGKCTPECGNNSDCTAGQTCAVARVCVPRAGVCVGDGSFCSPCRSDADCGNGAGDCLSGQPYSTERFCSVKATVSPCDTTRANPPGCPARATSDNWVATGCVTTPRNQCEGLVRFGTAAGTPTPVPGCWTINR